MKLFNTSSRTFEELRPLISFVRSQFSAAVRGCHLRIERTQFEGKLSGGIAQDFPDHQRVVIKLAEGALFPCLTHHPVVDDVGTIRLDSWEEDFIFVLAHELQHIEQFVTNRYPRELTVHQAEVEAEEMAYEVLLRWRKAARLSQLAA